jgi:mannose-6-phosphate isomerase-like protein (cupin superfamily)
MTAYTVKAIDELESINAGMVKLAGAELGIESFGMQVFDFPPGFPDYPEHDHAEDRQEEIYVVLRGSAVFEIGGERVPIESGRMLRIAPDTKRKLWPGADGIRILAIGCAPGRPYERPIGLRLRSEGSQAEI